MLTPAHLFAPDPIGLMLTWFLFVPGLLLDYGLSLWLGRRLVVRRMVKYQV